jgi:DNA-binding beta-propeller fold protein YncE
VAGGRVWLSGRAYPGVQPIVRVDPATNRRADTIPTAADGALGAGGGSVWHASSVTQTIYRLDPRSGRTLAEIPIGVVAKHLTVDAQSLWVGTDSGRVTRIDMATNTVTGTFQVSGRAPAVAVGYRAAWIVDTAHAALLRVQPGLAPQRHRVIGAGRWQRQQTWASSHAPAALARPSPASLAVAVAP